MTTIYKFPYSVFWIAPLFFLWIYRKQINKWIKKQQAKRKQGGM